MNYSQMEMKLRIKSLTCIMNLSNPSQTTDTDELTCMPTPYNYRTTIYKLKPCKVSAEDLYAYVNQQGEVPTFYHNETINKQ